MPTVSEIIARYIKREEVNHVFGVPGGASLPLMQACHKLDIEFILTNHETSAGFAADAYSFLRRKPGVCVTTLGPGATNAVSGAAQAYLERSPVLFITAQLPPRHYEAMTHQRIDTESLFRPVTKWSATITEDNVVPVLKRAHHMMFEDRPGPVHLSLPADVGEKNIPEASFDDFIPGFNRPTRANEKSIKKARESLAKADKPVIIAGIGVQRTQCQKQLEKLIETHHIPTLYTPKVKGYIPGDSQWAVGSVGLGMQADEIMLELLSESDLVVAVGFDQVELVTAWRDAIDPDTELIWVDYEPCEDGIYSVDISLIGDMKDTLEKLTDVSTYYSWNQGNISKRKERIQDTLIAQNDPCPGTMAPHRVSQIVHQTVPDDSIITCDVGAQKLMNTQIMPSYLPDTYLLTNGFSSMGYGLPAAIGAALSEKTEKQVICLAGDGGFAMTASEIETAVRHDLPVICIVFDDQTLSLIDLKQQRRGHQRNGVQFAPKDYEQFARGFGADGYNVNNEKALQKALSEALRKQKPTIIGCRIDRSHYSSKI